MAGVENTKIKKNVKIIRRSVLGLIAIGLLLVIILNFDQINQDNIRRVLAKIDFGMSLKAPDSGTIEFTADKQSKFAVYKGGLAILTKDKLNVYDTTGMELTNIQVASVTPAVSTNKKFIMTFDRGGNDLKLFNSFAMVFEKKFDGKIINASINDEGYMAVITRIEGYKALVTVFDTSFNEIYKWYSAENNVLSACVSPDGEKMVAGVLKTEGDATSICAEYFEITKEDSLRSVTLNGSFIFSLSFKDKNTVCAITDTECGFLDAGGDVKKVYSFGEESMTAFSDSNSKYTILAMGGVLSRQNSKVLALDNNGKEVVNSSVTGKIKSVSAGDSYIAALTDENALVFNMSGKTLKMFTVKSDYNLVFAVDNNYILLIAPTYAKYEKF